MTGLHGQGTLRPLYEMTGSKTLCERDFSMTSNFFAALSRMKYIERWALMRSSRPENLSEHAMEVAVIAHALCTIGNIRYKKQLNADRAAVVGLFHDASEIITGDMPTPVKYYNEELRRAYREVEAVAGLRLLSKLPQELRPSYKEIFEVPAQPDAAEHYLRRLVKAADKLSALIKCIEEEKAGNSEFRTAKATIQSAVDRLSEELPEVGDFVREFLPPYGQTLDELS